MTVNYHKPLPLGQNYHVVGWVEAVEIKAADRVRASPANHESDVSSADKNKRRRQSRTRTIITAHAAIQNEGTGG
jgi:hypothetical protein